MSCSCHVMFVMVEVLPHLFHRNSRCFGSVKSQCKYFGAEALFFGSLLALDSPVPAMVKVVAPRPGYPIQKRLPRSM